MRPLPEPQFVETDAAEILAESVAAYEAESGTTLLPASVERIQVAHTAYRETLVRQAIQDAAKQNLRRYARFPMIDLLGELIGGAGDRRAAQPAKTTLEWTLEEEDDEDTVIEEGRLVRTKNGKVTFAVDEELVIPAGELSGTVGATATEAGIIGNGYAIGQVTEQDDPLDGIEVENTNETHDGAEEEDTETYRERLPDAIAEYACGGPDDAYRTLAIKVHPDIRDVAIDSPTPGVVRLTVLAKNGVPSGEILEAVEDAMSAETVRPINDTVTVQAATPVDWTIEATITLYRGTKEATALAAANDAALAYKAEREARLGRNPDESAVKARLHVPGVFSVDVTTPGVVAVDTIEWGRCTSIEITVAGFVEEEAP